MVEVVGGGDVPDSPGGVRTAKSIPRICEKYDISESTVWKLAREGKLRLVKIGRARRLLPDDEDDFDRMLKGSV